MHVREHVHTCAHTLTRSYSVAVSCDTCNYSFQLTAHSSLIHLQVICLLVISAPWSDYRHQDAYYYDYSFILCSQSCVVQCALLITLHSVQCITLLPLPLPPTHTRRLIDALAQLLFSCVVSPFWTRHQFGQQHNV